MVATKLPVHGYEDQTKEQHLWYYTSADCLAVAGSAPDQLLTRCFRWTLKTPKEQCS